MSLHVDPDGSLLVREDITFEFRGAHRGVFRTIPLRGERQGFEYALRIDGIGAWDERGGPLRAEVSYPGRVLRIAAWVPDAIDATRTVILAYRVWRGLLGFEDHDELYWNATGDEWDVPIRRAEVVVEPPAGVPEGLLQAIAYTGLRGVVGQDYRLQRADRYLLFTTTRALRPREGLTVVVGWPAGHLPRPSTARQIQWLVADHWPLGLPVLVFALALLFWWAYGRDPAWRRSIKPEYEPPAGLIPAEAGTLVDERAEPRDVVATLVNLAVRGYLQIEKVMLPLAEPEFVFRRLKPVGGDPDLRTLELFVLAKLFGHDWGLNLRLLSEVRRDYDTVFPPSGIASTGPWWRTASSRRRRTGYGEAC